jgi:hypothetical protein
LLPATEFERGWPKKSLQGLCNTVFKVPLASFLFHVAREHMFDQARGFIKQ